MQLANEPAPLVLVGLHDATEQAPALMRRVADLRVQGGVGEGCVEAVGDGAEHALVLGAESTAAPLSDQV